MSGELTGGERVMEYRRIDLCRPCAEEMRAKGKRLRPVRHGVDNKVSCQRCQRRRYGATYEWEETGK